MFWFYLQNPLVTLHGFIQPPLHLQSPAEVEVRLCVKGAYPQNPLVVLDGLCSPSPVLKDKSQVKVCIDIIRFSLQGTP